MSVEARKPSHRCWCGGCAAQPTAHSEYSECETCGTACFTGLPPNTLPPAGAPEDFIYGARYWHEHMADLGYPDIRARARSDLAERCQDWLACLLRYRLPPGGLLELGCAHGGFVKLAGEAGFEACGIEMSREIVRYAESCFGVRVFVGPLESAEVPPSRFGAICLFDVLEHLPDPKATLLAARSILEPDGILLLQTPDYEPSRPSSWTHFKVPEHLFLFTRAALDGLLADLGLCHFERVDSLFEGNQTVVASASPLSHNTDGQIALALTASAGGRMVLAQQDLYHDLQRCRALGRTDQDCSRVSASVLLRALLRKIVRRGTAWITAPTDEVP